jgi:hypothetical protein
MVRHRLGPAGIFGECGARNPQLRRQPGDEAVDGIIHLCQGCAGMAEQRELHGKAQTIGSTAPACHKILVRSRECVMAGQGVRIAGHAQQQPAFLVCQQLSVRQNHPPKSQNSSS